MSSKEGSKVQGEAEQRQKGFSRRSFLHGAAVGSAILSSDAEAAPLSGDGTEPVGPGPVPMVLVVNGKPYRVTLEPRVTLIDALRSHLDYTGAKKVCDRATCGSCTVILDGQPVYACSVLAIDAQGQDIQTVESLSVDGKLHAVQKAFVENDAQQCGFCTPGFVMACKAYLDRFPRLGEVQSELGGNICRCGTYAGVREALADATRELR